MKIEKLDRLLGYLIAILLITVAVLAVVYKFDSCNKCGFEVDGKKLTGAEFMNQYAQKCLKKNQSSVLSSDWSDWDSLLDLNDSLQEFP